MTYSKNSAGERSIHLRQFFVLRNLSKKRLKEKKDGYLRSEMKKCAKEEKEIEFYWR
ncbi:hypothetical protein KFK09_012799 [Dendrobium nobile]|uniref:Uncharacterized protein n=1 Tax=Dendrobium nobile TaxID=94219 RepID=A0A8T3BJW1_DENNO|nr:hypothetical protein KFK09_012799 [Dendrobium nobile]